MNRKAIVEAIKNTIHEGQIYESEYNGKKYTSEVRDPEELDYEKIEETKGLKVTEVKREGGEGQGDEYTVVLSLKNESETMLVRIDASYNSYDGTDWSYCEVYECEPVQKTITVYEAVK